MMRKILFATAVCCGFVMGAAAQFMPVNNGAKGVSQTTLKGESPRSLKRLGEIPSTTLMVKKSVRRAEGASVDDYVLFESFEGWDGETGDWTPEGWSVEMRGEVGRESSWTPEAYSMYLPAPTDGQYYYAINYAMSQQDEWLISPMVAVSEGMMLSFDAYVDPLYLYNLDKVDWTALDFEGEREVAATLQIWAQAEGEDWVMLHDYADDFMDVPFDELLYMTPTSLEHKIMDLRPVEGKNARIAFRYVGIDGNLMLLDAVGISYPNLDGVSYAEPQSALYWGFDRSEGLSSTPVGVAQYPVFEPLTWTNSSDFDMVDYEWSYEDPENPGSILTSSNQDELTVIYRPDYTSEATKKNNFKMPHKLTASAKGATSSTFVPPYAYLQAGGKAEITFDDGSEFDGTLFPFCVQDLGYTYIQCEDTKLGEESIPVFGYDENHFVDDYWLKYTLNGFSANESDYSRLTGFGNLLRPTDAPLVVNGVTLYAYGKIEADAEITATIYGLNAGMSSAFGTFTKIASAVCKGSDIIASMPDYKYYIVLPFDFDEPVVLQSNAVHPAYMIFIENFRSDAVKYLAPLQSKTPDVVNWGYIMNDISVEEHTGRPPYTSIKAMVYKPDINGSEYVDPMAAFAIGLNAEYPWLTCDVETMDFRGETTVELGSYYDGSKLTVEAPEGLEASISGRYDECRLTLVANEDAQGTVTVSGPGVSISFEVKAEMSGILEIEKSGAATEEIFDLQGRRVAIPQKGFYIRNGEKVIVR